MIDKVFALVLDSDGEEDDSAVLWHSRPPMRENDLVALFNQRPIDSMFRLEKIVGLARSKSGWVVF